MPSLSVVITTFNEERSIGRCLASVRSIADEIIVVDSFSTDGTETICRALGVNFLHRVWEGYSPAKNFGNEAARHDAILSLDADEALSPELQRSIAALKTAPAIEPCKFNRLTNYCGAWIRHGGWYPDVKVRLFNRTQTRWVGRIHERLEGIDETRAVQLSGDCHHYSYYSVAEHKAQARRFADIAAAELACNGKRATLVHCALHPSVKFLRDFLLKRGFLDGRTGFTVAAISAYATFRKYNSLRLRGVQETAG
jgi:glycosyltransferase involved in cell wall biosynthesis